MDAKWEQVTREGSVSDGGSSWLEFIEVPGGRLYRTTMVIEQDRDGDQQILGLAMCFVPEPPSQPAPPADVEVLLQKPLDSLYGVSTRARGALHRADIRNVRDLVQKDEFDLLYIDNFGRESLIEVVDALRGLGLHLGMRL